MPVINRFQYLIAGLSTPLAGSANAALVTNVKRYYDGTNWRVLTSEPLVAQIDYQILITGNFLTLLAATPGVRHLILRLNVGTTTIFAGLWGLGGVNGEGFILGDGQHDKWYYPEGYILPVNTAVTLICTNAAAGNRVSAGVLYYNI
jgi:hypothetical protein